MPRAAKKQAEEGSEPQAVAPADAAPPAADGAAGDKPKKKRNNNPGIRVQGGRVYDSENGTTCHQCRQKTAECKAKCTKCTLYFCPKCLENRYQEVVAECNARGDWACPRCRGLCNCSNCRKKAGMEATGQLANIAKKAGFGSVKELLVKNPNAKALALPKLPRADSGAAASGAAGRARSTSAAPAGSQAAGSQGDDGAGAAVAPKRAPAKRKAAVAAEAEAELVADEELPPRTADMPEARPLAAHKSVAGQPAPSKRPRGGLGWVADADEVVPLPVGTAGAELAVVLEFLQVFGGKLGFRAAPPLAPLAAELLQHPEGAAEGAPLLCPSPEDSLVGVVHCRLLELVRAYWNVKGEVAPGAWQGLMRGYWAAAQLSRRAALNLRWAHGPPAVAGEIFTRPQEESAAAEAEQDGDGDVPMTQEGEEATRGAGGAAAVAAADYPAGGYWGLPAAARVGLLHALVHDALETDELRAAIEGSMGDALDEEKERRQQLAGVRKEAREAIARERDQQIALMIANATGGLTLEQQQELLEQARQRAEAAANSAAAAKVWALSEKVHPPTVRAAVVGCDREGRRYLALQSAPLLTGEGGVVVQTVGAEGEPAPEQGGGAQEGESYGGHPSSALAAVAAALHPQGRREGPLRAALVRSFKLRLPGDAPAAPSGGSSREASQEAEQAPAAEGEEEPAAAREREPRERRADEPAAEQQAAGAPGPKNGRMAAAPRQKQQKQAPLEPAGAPPGAPTGSKRSRQEPGSIEAAAAAAACGGRKAGARGRADSPAAAAEPAAEAPAAGKRRRGRNEAASPAEPAERPAAAKRGRKALPADKTADKPAAAAGKRGTRARKPQAASSGGQLPLKVDDLF